MRKSKYKSLTTWEFAASARWLGATGGDGRKEQVCRLVRATARWKGKRKEERDAKMGRWRLYYNVNTNTHFRRRGMAPRAHYD